MNIHEISVSWQKVEGGKTSFKIPHYLKATVYGNANNEINDVNVNKTKKKTYQQQKTYKQCL